MKKLCMIFVMALLLCVLTMPVMAEADYATDTPAFEEITIEDEQVAQGMLDSASTSDQGNKSIEEVEITDPDVAKGAAPQTNDSIMTPVILTIISGLGLVTSIFFIVKKRVVKK